ncbi:hypothetical protein FKM82_025209 [Ascaphus truei]
MCNAGRAPAHQRLLYNKPYPLLDHALLLCTSCLLCANYTLLFISSVSSSPCYLFPPPPLLSALPPAPRAHCFPFPPHLLYPALLFLLLLPSCLSLHLLPPCLA